MIINPISINGNNCKSFNSCKIEDMSVLEGGYIITPKGEIIVVKDDDEHKLIFSEYINAYLEKNTNEIYDVFTAMRMICEFGCIAYSGIRMEYAKNKLANLSKTMGTLALPSELSILTKVQSEICMHLISTNKSIIGGGEKIFIQYTSFPDTIYTKEQVLEILNKNIIKKDIENKGKFTK